MIAAFDFIPMLSRRIALTVLKTQKLCLALVKSKKVNLALSSVDDKVASNL